jgi:translation initiation factor 3 subunit B
MLSGLDNVLVVDNLPSVNSDRRQKLLDRARQQFAKAGSPLSGKQREDGSYEDMEMPWDQEGDSNKG